MRLTSPVPIAAWRGVPVSRRVSRVCTPSIATLFVRRIIGLSIRKNANYVLPSYATRRCLKTPHLWMTVPFASYQCQKKWYAVSRFYPRLYLLYQFMTSRLNMRSWKMWVWPYIFPAAERAFVEVVSTPSVSLETWSYVHFVIQRERAKRMKKRFKK